MKSSTFFALLTGMAAGAVLGVLFAPEKGEESRKKVKKMAEDCLGKVKDKLSDLSTEAELAEEDE